MAEFIESIKSTIDKKCIDLAVGYNGGTAYADLNDNIDVEKILGSPDDVLIWEILSFDESPIDPLYTVNFQVGAKNSSDKGGYALTKFIGYVKTAFGVQDKITVRDYTGVASPTVDAGFMIVTSVGISPQEFERISNIRMALVSCRAVRSL